MSESSQPTSVTDEAALRGDLAAAVTAVSGVARLEPTLRNVLARFAGSRRTVNHDGPAAADDTDGITVVSYGQITDVRIDLVVTAQACATAVEVQQRVRAALASRGREPGVVAVNVVAVEPHQLAASAESAESAESADQA